MTAKHPHNSTQSLQVQDSVAAQYESVSKAMLETPINDLLESPPSPYERAVFAGFKMLAEPSVAKRLKSRQQTVRVVRMLLSELGLAATPDRLSPSKSPALFALAKPIRPRGARK